VFPAAGLVRRAPFDAEKVVVSLDLDEIPRGFRFLRGKATEVVPSMVADWMA
jgi:NAD-dependent deacetylase